MSGNTDPKFDKRCKTHIKCLIKEFDEHSVINTPRTETPKETYSRYYKKVLNHGPGGCSVGKPFEQSYI